MRSSLCQNGRKASYYKILQCPIKWRTKKGKPNLRWFYGLEKGVLLLRTKNWRTVARRRLAMTRLLEKAKTHLGLSSH
ncbi:hypothetical protein TNCV_745791 [Trichonephila clavipes]|nr:hypothetical protein TNCV_745791 [Trichonephila clavipes]